MRGTGKVCSGVWREEVFSEKPLSGLIREKETDEEVLGKESCKPKSQPGRSLVGGSIWFDVDPPRTQGSWKRMKREVREEGRIGGEIGPSSLTAQVLTMKGEVWVSAVVPLSGV